MAMMDEMVLPVRPMSLRTVLEFAEAFLQKHFPEMLTRPQPLDVGRLAEVVLPREKIRVYAEPSLSDYGVTRFADADDSVEILMRENLFEALFDKGDRNHIFAASTLVHETSHALRHMPQFLAAHRRAKRAGRRTDIDHTLHRRRADLKPYVDPEWQAYAIEGALLAPLAAIRLMPISTVGELATTFGTSFTNMQAHVKRLTSQNLMQVRPPTVCRWPQSQGGVPMR